MYTAPESLVLLEHTKDEPTPLVYVPVSLFSGSVVLHECVDVYVAFPPVAHPGPDTGRDPILHRNRDRITRVRIYSLRDHLCVKLEVILGSSIYSPKSSSLSGANRFSVYYRNF